jgi:hypothetical protein
MSNQSAYTLEAWLRWTQKRRHGALLKSTHWITDGETLAVSDLPDALAALVN